MSAEAITPDGKQESIPFGEYSAIYDLIYRSKDYSSEAGFVAALIQRFAPHSETSVRILDMACGTGRHAIELSGMGFTIEGSDISSGMIAMARKRAVNRGLEMKFHECSFQTANAIPGSFDVVLAMFASLGYLIDFDDFWLTLNNVANKLTRGGIFIFDVWNGAAVLTQYSPYKIRHDEDDERKVERISRTTLDNVAQLATVKFEFRVEYVDGVVKCFTENHHVRFYFPQEMTDLLSALGFEVIFRCPFLSVDKPLAGDDWNMTYVVRKKSDTLPISRRNSGSPD